MHFAEGNRAPAAQWFRVMRHKEVILSLPDVVSPNGKIRRVTRDICRYPCANDEIVLDFLPSWEIAQRLASKFNLSKEQNVHSGRHSLLVGG